VGVNYGENIGKIKTGGCVSPNMKPQFMKTKTGKVKIGNGALVIPRKGGGGEKFLVQSEHQ